MQGVSTKKLFQLHRQWLQYAKTRSARHKLTKVSNFAPELRSSFDLVTVSRIPLSPQLHGFVQFLKEQAALSAEEITADSINEFIADLNEDECDDDPYSSDTSAIVSMTNGKPLSTSNGDPFGPNAYQYDILSLNPKNNGAANGAAKGAVNGTANGAVNGAANWGATRGANGAVNGTGLKLPGNGAGNGTALKLRGNGSANGSAKSKVCYIQDEARAGIEAWKMNRIALWHTSGGGSVQWFSVCCHDRNSTLLHFAFPALIIEI